MLRLKRTLMLILVIFVLVSLMQSHFFTYKTEKSYTKNADSQEISDIDIYGPLKNLDTKLQERIYELQHPTDCDNTRLVIYDMNAFKCGSVCQLHHLLMFYILAFDSNRTLIIQNEMKLQLFKPYVGSSCKHWETDDSIKDAGLI